MTSSTSNEIKNEIKDEDIYKRWQNTYGVPAVWRMKSFLDFKRDPQPTAYDKLYNYTGGSYVLLSPQLFGVGKTHLACALANALIDIRRKTKVNIAGAVISNPCPVYFTTENELLLRIRNCFISGAETEDKVYQALRMFKLLIIDDVGKVKPRDYSFLQGVYFALIDERYTSGKDIIITTNLSGAELEAHIGGACADRLREMCGDNFITMKGKSYRCAK